MDRTKNHFSPGIGTPPPERAGPSVVLEDAMLALEGKKKWMKKNTS